MFMAIFLSKKVFFGSCGKGGGDNLFCILRLPGGRFSLCLGRFGFSIPEIGYIQCFMILHKSEGSYRFLELPSPANGRKLKSVQFHPS